MQYRNDTHTKKTSSKVFLKNYKHTFKMLYTYVFSLARTLGVLGKVYHTLQASKEGGKVHLKQL